MNALHKILLCMCVSCLFASVFGGELGNGKKAVPDTKIFKSQPYSSQSDIAFVSVWGSRPDAKKLQGFQKAVLYNARGEIVKKVDMGKDSVYSLDKMIQENKTKGPLFIRMYK